MRHERLRACCHISFAKNHRVTCIRTRALTQTRRRDGKASPNISAAKMLISRNRIECESTRCHTILMPSKIFIPCRFNQLQSLSMRYRCARLVVPLQSRPQRTRLYNVCIIVVSGVRRLLNVAVHLSARHTIQPADTPMMPVKTIFGCLLGGRPLFLCVAQLDCDRRGAGIVATKVKIHVI